jgi:CubicO group peptidase (beta-lactamase class C family)
MTTRRAVDVCLLFVLAGSACSSGSNKYIADSRDAARDTASSSPEVQQTTDVGCDQALSDSAAADMQPTSQPGVLRDYLGDPAYPDDFWTSTTPAAANVDDAVLEQAVKMIANTKLEIHSFLVARYGRIVFEHYGWSTGSNSDDPNQTNHQVVPTERYPVNSTTKSFLSALVGIAIADGLIPGVSDLVVPHFPEYQPLDAPSMDKDSITIEDLLTMRSGLQYDGTVDDDVISQATDPAQIMLSRPVVDTPVGQVWNYSSGGSDIIAALLRKVTGQTPLDYANQKLFGALGFANVTWGSSTNGTNHGG